MSDTTGSVAIQISKTPEEKFEFKNLDSTGSGITFDDGSRTAKITAYGTFQLSYSMDGFDIKDPGITWGPSPDGTTTPPTGYTVSEETDGSSFTITVTVSESGGAETATFLIHQDSTEVIDPTILVEPPGGVASDEPAAPSLVVNVSLSPAGDYVYTPDQADTPHMVWLDVERTAKISEVGVFKVIFKAAFKLGPLGILFPDGKPGNVTRSKDENVVTLEIVARPLLIQVIPLRIEKSDSNFVRNEPTILVEPPGGKK